MGYISKEEYMEQINQIIDLLEGKTDKIIRQLKKEMEEASIKFEYEKAAYIRDKILAIDNISKRQKVSNLSENDIRQAVRGLLPTKLFSTSIYPASLSLSNCTLRLPAVD